MGERLKISIELNKLEGFKSFTGKDGNEYICFPAAINKIYTGKDGQRKYMFLTAIEQTRPNNYGTSHFITHQQGERKEGDRYDPEVIVGDIKRAESKQQTPAAPQSQQQQSNPQPQAPANDEDPDLPF